MSDWTDGLDDMWEPLSSPSQPTHAPRSRQPYPSYGVPPPSHAWDSIGNLRERTARLEESNRHSADTAQLVISHQQEALRMIADRLQASIRRMESMDERLRTQEDRQGKAGEAITKMEPVVTHYTRTQDRKRLLKDSANWIAAGAVIYLAASGRIVWGDALRALGKMLGVG